MRKNLGFAVAFAICVLAASTIVGVRRFPVVHAQSKECDLASLTGAYGYTLSGSVYDNQYNVYLIGAAGRVVSDGNGNLAGADTFSFDGNIAKRQYTGTYTITAECTGTMTLGPLGGSSTVPLHADFVAVNNVKELNLVQTDAAFILTGVMKQQNQ